MVGKSLPYFTTHADLVARQAEAKKGRDAKRSSRDDNWKGDIANEMRKLVTD